MGWFSKYHDFSTGNTKIVNTDSYHLPVYPLNPSEFDGTAGHLFCLLQENLIPKDFNSETNKLFKDLSDIYKKEKESLILLNGQVTLMEEGLIPCSSITTLTGKSFDFATMKAVYTSTLPITSPVLEAELRQGLEHTLLHCDKVRADLDPYHSQILTDPNGGHWDLWEELESKSGIALQLTTPLMGRNPLADVREDGMIGIDFGTKSTVVVYQEHSEHTLPLRVGTGQLSKKIAPSHYENPTVLEFVDLENFLTAYRAKDGRPNTTWEQVTSSHTAFNSLLGSNSNQYYAFLYELKQWAGDSGRKIHLRDKQNYDILLESYTTLKEDDFDPIEVYAYYLGLYINNMHNGIYLNYLLSYPVTYEQKVRDRILESFRRGIKKSLPSSILQNADVMKKFRVNLGASEPVSYAICALEQYGFEPEVGEELFYAVFDFGGGTSDFDFGLFRGVDEDKYDFIVESFGSSGDQFLGGENLLELLSYEVFKKNQDSLREKSIAFERPTECKRFSGDELLISDSQEAKLNMAQLKEILRPLWERHEGYEETFETGIIKVNLYDKQGKSLLNEELELSLTELEAILRSRIEQGVNNFFHSLVSSMNLPKNTDKVEKIHILLAGNSSKSVILREVMEEAMEKFSKTIGESAQKKDYFQIFPPLGTEEGDAFIQSLGMEAKPRTIESPTCKTGVAFGLLGSREGSRIKLVRETAVTEEVKFPFYLGKERRKKFKFLSTPSLGYGKWVKFTASTEERFTLFYSRLPSVLTGETPIANVERKLCTLEEVFPEGYVYFRAISPHEVEYVVATEDGILAEEYLAEPVMVVLQEM